LTPERQVHRRNLAGIALPQREIGYMIELNLCDGEEGIILSGSSCRHSLSACKGLCFSNV
jgi:hypothetical protein